MTEPPLPVCFVGYCWGAAGSSWLAQVLNAHEAVLCLHSPAVPRFDHFRLEDTSVVLRALVRSKSLGRLYAAAGVTHGVPIEWQATLAGAVGLPLREFVLVRDPLPRARSVVELHRRLAAEDRLDPRYREAYRALRRRVESATGRRLDDDLETGALLHACQQLNSIVQEQATKLPIFRLEDLVRGPEALDALLAHVSDGACRFEPGRVDALQRRRIGAHAPGALGADAIWDAWRPHERDAFRVLLAPEARKAYEALGYALP